MRITLNGEAREVAPGTTLEELVGLAGIRGRRYAVEVNGEIRPRAEHAGTAVEAGDHVEVVQAIGGG
ncbi:sulfur carrier protein ThiS [Guyparkeria sp.]|uniref:sulfur carrier protein ThiS n=1 Tax=Guyparkeria sp. TaxID=2035736 RepID=UPI0035654076